MSKFIITEILPGLPKVDCGIDGKGAKSATVDVTITLHSYGDVQKYIDTPAQLRRQIIEHFMKNMEIEL